MISPARRYESAEYNVWNHSLCSFFFSQIQGGELQIFCAKVEKKFIVHYNILRYGGTEIQQTLIGEQPIQVDL